MGETAQQPTALSTRQPIPGVASLQVNPERIERMWKMTALQRVEAAHQGQFTLGEMLRWAARRPREVPLGSDGEWFFISFFTADTCDTAGPGDTSRPVAAAAGDMSSRRTR